MTTQEKELISKILAESLSLDKSENMCLLYVDNSYKIKILTKSIYPSIQEVSFLKGVRYHVQSQLDLKQPLLVSGNNIKTINKKSILGKGDISIDRVFNEVPAGAIDGINNTFVTSYDFIPESVEVFINGIKQNLINDFTTYGNNTVILVFSLTIGEDIKINYTKK